MKNFQLRTLLGQRTYQLVNKFDVFRVRQTDRNIDGWTDRENSHINIVRQF